MRRAGEPAQTARRKSNEIGTIRHRLRGARQHAPSQSSIACIQVDQSACIIPFASTSTIHIRRSMPFRSMPLSNFPAVRSSDPEFVRDLLCRKLGAAVSRSRQARTNSGARQPSANRRSRTDLLRLCRRRLDRVRRSLVRAADFQYSGPWSLRHGQPSATCPGDRNRSCPPGHRWFDFRSRYRHLLLRIELDALARYLSALVGQEVGSKLQFEEGRDVCPGHEQPEAPGIPVRG